MVKLVVNFMFSSLLVVTSRIHLLRAWLVSRDTAWGNPAHITKSMYMEGRNYFIVIIFKVTEFYINTEARNARSA